MSMQYTYDLAISFAEEDRNAALALVLALEMQGVKNIYYYPLHYEATWGNQLEEKLASIYSMEAKYALVLVSAKYFGKRFCQIELKAIQQRQAQDTDIVYVLPIILDETANEAAASFSTVGYVKWEYNPKEVALLVARLLGNNIEKVEKAAKNTPANFTLLSNNIVETNNVIVNDGAAPVDSKPTITFIKDSKFLVSQDFIVNRNK